MSGAADRDERPAPAPPPLRPRSLLLVVAGGAVGTAAREGAALLIGSDAVAVLLVNLVGAFLLGVLVTSLLRLREGPSRDDLRLGLGTGFCGGFTTYSALAIITVGLPPAAAVAYAAGTVLLGAGAAAAGVALGTGFARRTV